MFVSIGQASVLIGVSVSTLRRWECEKRFSPSFRTEGGHRRYSVAEIKLHFLAASPREQEKVTIAYARVSSQDQKEDLRRQEATLLGFCAQKNWSHILISDLGSGLNYRKKGLTKLLQLICQGKASRLVLTHKDRLLRFGSPLIFQICQQFGTEVFVINQDPAVTFEEELVRDVLEIVTVFSSKLYGRRSHENRRRAA